MGIQCLNTKYSNILNSVHQFGSFASICILIICVFTFFSNEILSVTAELVPKEGLNQSSVIAISSIHTRRNPRSSPIPPYPFETAYAHLIGDPHVRSLNGKDFDCMGSGEYVLFVLPRSAVKSTDMVPIRVHATFLGRANGPGSVCTGVSVRVHSQVSFLINLDDEEGVVVLGKCIASIQLSLDGPVIHLLRGRHIYSDTVEIEYTGLWVVLYVKKDSTSDFKMRIVFETVRTSSIGCYFSLVQILIPTRNQIMTTRTRGLFGSVQNGFQKPNGRYFNFNDNSDVRFCHLWCVKNDKFSIFNNVSSPCRLFPTFSVRSVKQLEASDENNVEIENICGGNLMCRFDAIVNGLRAARAFMRALFISEAIASDSVSSSPLVSNAPAIRFAYVSKNRIAHQNDNAFSRFYDG